ncbi:MAG: phage tail protein [Paracoccaceae bacterium]|nr:phage tail protein [Paracoccaceae bacterium]
MTFLIRRPTAVVGTVAHGVEVTFPDRRKNGKDHLWITHYDGSQTTADAELVELFGPGTTRRNGDPMERVWTEDHILAGRPYVKVKLRGNYKVWKSGKPNFHFVMSRLPFYDSRRDPSLGGTGAQSWDTPATWEPTRNPITMIWNIARGMILPSGDVWGGGYDADDLPLAMRVAAMNACDADMDGRPRYTAGLPIDFTQPPNQVVAELLASCNAQIADYAGYLLVRLSAPAVPLVSIVDEDIRVDDPRERDLFPAPAETYNAIVPRYSATTQLWNGFELEPILRPEWEAADGGRNTLPLELIAVDNAAQAAQLGNEALEDDHNFLRHVLPLLPEHAILRPLDSLAWSSDQYGYDGKAFEVFELAVDHQRLRVKASLRERDAAASAHVPALELPEPPTPELISPAEDSEVPDFDAQPHEIADGSGAARRPALRLTWTGDDIASTTSALQFETKVKETDQLVRLDVTQDVDKGELVIEVLPGVTYLTRPRQVSLIRDTEPGDWVEVTAPDTRLTSTDLTDGLSAVIQTAFDRHNEPLEAAQPGTVADVREATISPTVPALPLWQQLEIERTRINREIPHITNGERVTRDAIQQLMALE